MDIEIDKVATKRSLTKRLLRWSIGIAVGVTAAFFAYRYIVHKSSTAENRAANEKAKVVKPVTITTARVSSRSVRRSVDVVGTLYGFEEIAISSNVEGRIKRVLAEVGDRVDANSKLAEIDPTNFELSVRQAQRSLDVELAGLGLTKLPTGDFDIKDLPMVREAQSRLKFAGLTESRTRELSRSNAVSAQDLDSVVADLQTAEANYESKLLQAKASLATIKLRDEALAIAQQQLQDTMIRAPSPEHPIPFAENEKTYAVSSRDVSEGTFVRTGQEVCRLVIDGALRLRVQVPERHLATIATGQPAEVTTSAYPDPIIGKVSLINPVIIANTRTFEVEILIENSSRRLKPGGFAKAKIITNQDDTAISVPLESLVTFAGITKVFLVENGYAKEVQVTVGEQGLDWVEVVSPKLEPQSVIVTSGQTALADKTPVVERAVFSDSEKLKAEPAKPAGATASGKPASTELVRRSFGSDKSNE